MKARQAVAGTYPVVAVGRLKQIARSGGQPLRHTEVLELVSIEAGDPLAGAKPEETVGVRDNAIDCVPRQSIGGGVNPHRQLLGPQARETKDQTSCATRQWLLAGQDRAYLYITVLAEYGAHSCLSGVRHKSGEA
jgi:hypothetical protein